MGEVSLSHQIQQVVEPSGFPDSVQSMTWLAARVTSQEAS